MPEKLPIKVIAGLGNPGKQYEITRHNIGFMLVDDWVADLSWKWKRSFRFRGEWCKGTFGDVEVNVIKPHTFMNASGKSLHAILKYLKLAPSQLMCIYDDITLPLGRVKLSIGGGDGGHNGIKDTQRLLGNDFTRFRVGVGQKPHSEMDLKDWVLSQFNPEEVRELEANKAFYRNSIGKVIQTGPVLAMNTINQKPNL